MGRVPRDAAVHSRAGSQHPPTPPALAGPEDAEGSDWKDDYFLFLGLLMEHLSFLPSTMHPALGQRLNQRADLYQSPLPPLAVVVVELQG